MAQNKKIKIALVGKKHSDGGAERVLSNLSFAFERLGYEVHVIVTVNDVTYPYAGKLFNIGLLRDSSNSFFNRINRFLALRKYIRQEKFDIIIDFRTRVNGLYEFMVYKFAYVSPIKIQTVHLGKFSNYLLEQKWLSKLIFKKFDKIICISEKQKEAVEKTLGFTNLALIYNPIDITNIQQLKSEKPEIDFKYIIAIGRFAKAKQFDKLIPAYSQSELPKQNIHLVILGQGEEEELIKKMQSESEYSDKIHLMGFKKNPYKYISNSQFIVQCSSVEGLPMVLLEALACETPIVAFDCPTGPSEIVIDGINGILVENQNFENFIQSMNKMVSDKDFYKKCKSNTLDTVQKFDISVIEKQWKNLIEELTEKRLT